MSELHSLDLRVSSLEQRIGVLDERELPLIYNTIQKEIPAHYNKRIIEAKETTMLELGNLIDAKLDKRFGWLPRSVETIVTGLIVAVVVYGLGLL
jgi:hypothetical protein